MTGRWARKIDWHVFYTDEALKSLKRLKKHDRIAYQQARSMIGLVAEDPDAMGYPLDGRWHGARACHFGRDRYRLIWELNDERHAITVLLVGAKQQRRSTIYDRPRPDTAR